MAYFFDANLSYDLANTARPSTDFNKTPYYDDYDVTKNFNRILFKPGYAVQGRELTQLQTILQNQIYRFGRHVFDEGSIVIPGGIDFRLKSTNYPQYTAIDYVKVKSTDLSNNDITVSDYKYETVTGQTNNVKAYVVDVLDSDGTTSNTKTLYVTYTQAAGNIRYFVPGETLLTGNSETAIVLSTDATANVGFGSWMKINDGVIFAKQHFIYFPSQSIILDRYNPSPNCKVGFRITEQIVDADMDATLLDPALEASNYGAPGADRFKFNVDLDVVPLDYVGDEDFVTLAIINNGEIEFVKNRSQYNIIGDEIAGRTYDESGDYIVNGFNVQIQEHYRKPTTPYNYGKYSANGNTSLLVANIEKGSGYAKGYSIINPYTRELTLVKPQAYTNVLSEITATSMGQYFRVNELVGTWELGKNNRVKFYDEVQYRITGAGNTIASRWSTKTQTGNNIGSAIFNSIQYVSGTPGYDAIWDIYVTDVTMIGSNTVGNVRSLYFDGSGSDIGADILGANNTTSNTYLRDISKSCLVYPIAGQAVKTTKDKDGNPTAIYYFSKTDSGTISTGGLVTFTVSGANEKLPYGAGPTVLSDTDVYQDIVFNFNESFNVALSGTVTANGTTVVGSGTNFDRLNPGDKVEITGRSNTWYVVSVSNSTYMVVSNTMVATGNSIYKAYKTGDIVDFTGKGVTAGTDRTVTATTSTLAFDIKETLPATKSVSVTYKVAANLVSAASKTLNPNRLVAVNCASAGVTGPYCLGFSDVYKIRNVVVKTGSVPSTTVDGTNVTEYFYLDNGQRDTQYDLAYLYKLSALTLGATDYLLIELDYFTATYSTKSSFFSVDSYPVDDTTTANNKIKTEEIPFYTSPVTKYGYNLRNAIDFRPVKNITANDTTTMGSASVTVNPSNTSNSYAYSGLSYMKYPVPSTEVTYDFSDYLGRKDLIVVDQDGNYYVLTGEPAYHPKAKSPTDNQMVIAMLTIPPYPALSPQYAKSINRKDLAVAVKKLTNRRYTMRDIGVLDKRISNLEYYAALSLLEKSALDLKILDDAGIERFKNGIFVDAFKDETSSAKAYALDYRIALDPKETCIRPIFVTESILFDYISGTGVTKHSKNLVTLNYDEVTYFTQNHVTDYRNLERGVYNYRGQLFLTPSEDIWVDTSFAPDENLTIAADNNTRITLSSATSTTQSHLIGKNIINTSWGQWNRIITGVDVYTNGQLQGTFNTVDEAQSYIASLGTSYSQTTSTGTFWGGSDGGSGAIMVGSQTTTTTTTPDATIVVRGTTQRTGTATYNNPYQDSVTGDAKLVSSEIIPYMRPDSILVQGKGLKPKSHVHAFFDQIAVSDFCTPLTSAEYTSQLEKEIANTSYLPVGTTASESDDLIVNDDGSLYFIFRIPSTQPRFRVGEKHLIVIDGEQLADVIDTEIDASTSAIGKYYANGTKQVLQKTVYSTKGAFTTTTPVVDTGSFTETDFIAGSTKTTQTFTTSPLIMPPNSSCMAYTIPILNIPTDENGIFVTAFDIFVQQKSSTRGLWFEIRECDSAGMVTNLQVPGTEVHYTNSQINVSSDGLTNATKVVFPFPIFLFNKKSYAFIVHSDNPPGASIDQDTTLWISRLGETDRNTGLKINERQFKGSFFQSINSLTYNLVPDVDMVINVYRANFNTQSGTFYIGNKPVERLILANTAGTFNRGNYLISGDILTLSGANGTISITDRLKGNVSIDNANSQVVTVVGGGVYRVANTKYSIGEKVGAWNIAGYYTGVSATVTAISNTTAKIDYVTSGTNTFLDLVNSSGTFLANDVVHSVSNYNTNYGTITSIYDYKYSVVDFEPKVLEFAKTGITYQIATYPNSSYTLGSYQKILPGDYLYYDEEKSLYSRSTELTELSGNKKSVPMYITMTSTSSYVSPVFDLDYSNAILIENIINSNTSGETGTFGGSAINRYISQTVTLAEDQDAEDMRVIVTAYRPPATDVKVYIKILNSDDTDVLANKSWIELEKQGDGDATYSSLATRFDYKDYGYQIPAANLDTAGVVYYTSNGATYKTYRYFIVKIVLTSTNPAIVPKVNDLRVIAMQT